MMMMMMMNCTTSTRGGRGLNFMPPSRSLVKQDHLCGRLGEIHVLRQNRTNFSCLIKDCMSQLSCFCVF